MALRALGIRVLADMSNYMTNLGRGAAATKQFTGELDKASRGGHLEKISDSAGVLGIGLAGVAAGAIKMSMDFDKSMSAVAAASGAGAADMEKLRAAAIQAGKDTQFSATEAADGITELSKAGVQTADILHGGLKGALDLAAAGQISVAEASETAASAMTQFSLSGEKVPHIADLLAAGAGKAQGSVHDMGAALNQSGLVASQFGLSIEDTTGVLAEFAHAGLTGSDAGTSFKSMLLAMANPTDNTKSAMEALGISFYDAQGKFIGLSGVAKVLQDRLKGLTQEQRNAALSQIFGSDAIRSASILYTDGAEGVQKWRDAVNDSGYASENAAKLTDNLAGDLERLKGSLETLAVSSGEGANKGLRIFTQAANGLVDQLGKMSPVGGSAVVAITGLVGVSALALAAFIKLRSGLTRAVEELNTMGPAGERAATGLQKAAGMAGKTAIAFAALETASAVFNHMATDSVNVDRLTDSLTNLMDTGKSAGELNDIFGGNFDKLGRIAAFADSADHGYGKFVNNVLGSIPVIGDAGIAIGNFGNRLIAGTDFEQAKEQMASLDTAMTNYMNSTNDAKKSSELWNRVASESGIPIEHLIELLPNAYKKVGELNNAADAGKSAMNGAAAGAKNAAAGTDEMGKAADKAAEEIDNLNKAIKSLVDNQLSADRADIKARDGMEELTKSFNKGSRSLDINKEAGRKNRLAVLDQIDAIENLREANVEHGMALDQANRKYLKDIDGLRKSMIQAGFSKKAVDQLIGSYKKLPPNAVTKVDIQGEEGVNKALDKLLVKQYALAKGLSPTAAAASVQKDLDRNRRRGYAEGGWTGPGSMYQPAGIVHADEYVIRKPSRQKLEKRYPGLLDAMNTTGGIPEDVIDATPGFAAGGRVWPFPVTASKAHIPTLAQVLAAVTPAGPSGGATDDWIVRTVMAHFPGMHYISKFRPGAMTLTGHRSYHSMHRAVDWPASHALAQWWHDTFMARTKELITPWNDLNIHNGRPHHYTGAVWNQHNFAGGNAHDHIAMKNGGTITEPVFGVGASGRTYSFGENWLPERVTPGGQSGNAVTIVLENHGVIGSQMEVDNWLAGAVNRLKLRGRV